MEGEISYTEALLNDYTNLVSDTAHSSPRLERSPSANSGNQLKLEQGHRKLSSSYEKVYDDVEHGEPEAPLSPNAYNFVRGIREDLYGHNHSSANTSFEDVKFLLREKLPRRVLADASLDYDADNDLTQGSLGSGSSSPDDLHPLATVREDRAHRVRAQ